MKIGLVMTMQDQMSTRGLVLARGAAKTYDLVISEPLELQTRTKFLGVEMYRGLGEIYRSFAEESQYWIECQNEIPNFLHEVMLSSYASEIPPELGGPQWNYRPFPPPYYQAPDQYSDWSYDVAEMNKVLQGKWQDLITELKTILTQMQPIYTGEIRYLGNRVQAYYPRTTISKELWKKTGQVDGLKSVTEGLIYTTDTYVHFQELIKPKQTPLADAPELPKRARRLKKRIPKWLYPWMTYVEGTLVGHQKTLVQRRINSTVTSVTMEAPPAPTYEPDPFIVFANRWVLCGWEEEDN